MHKDYDFIRRNFRYDPDTGELKLELGHNETKLVTERKFYFSGRAWSTLQLIIIYQTGYSCVGMYFKDKTKSNFKWNNITAGKPPMTRE